MPRPPVSSGALDAIADWPVRNVAAGWLRADGATAAAGAVDLALPWASVTKVLTALATWIAVEEGTLAWDVPAGPPGSTVAHLLAHASGLGPDGPDVMARPGTRRIYSNTGFEVLGDTLAAAAGMEFATYVTEGVLAPLGMTGTTVVGGAASGAVGPLSDVLRLGAELLRPTLVSEATLAAATTVAFPGLAGVLPGFGRMEPNDWGLGVELKGRKRPHWTPPSASPRTFGHFGRSGGFLWVDPEAKLACASLSDRNFGSWAAVAWPDLGEAVVAEALGRASGG